MALNFDKHAAKGNEFLNLLANELNIPENKDKAGRILRSVLRALRNRLTPEESIQLISQLPMALKAVYVEGWKFTKKPEKIKHLDDFIIEIMNEDKMLAIRDFTDDFELAKFAVECVFKTLAKYVSEGELNDMASVLPKELSEFVFASTHS